MIKVMSYYSEYLDINYEVLHKLSKRSYEMVTSDLETFQRVFKRRTLRVQNDFGEISLGAIEDDGLVKLFQFEFELRTNGSGANFLRLVNSHPEIGLKKVQVILKSDMVHLTNQIVKFMKEYCRNSNCDFYETGAVELRKDFNLSHTDTLDYVTKVIPNTSIIRKDGVRETGYIIGKSLVREFSDYCTTQNITVYDREIMEYSYMNLGENFTNSVKSARVVQKDLFSLVNRKSEDEKLLQLFPNIQSLEYCVHNSSINDVGFNYLFFTEMVKTIELIDINSIDDQILLGYNPVLLINRDQQICISSRQIEILQGHNDCNYYKLNGDFIEFVLTKGDIEIDDKKVVPILPIYRNYTPSLVGNMLMVIHKSYITNLGLDSHFEILPRFYPNDFLRLDYTDYDFNYNETSFEMSEYLAALPESTKISTKIWSMLNEENLRNSVNILFTLNLYELIVYCGDEEHEGVEILSKKIMHSKTLIELTLLCFNNSCEELLKSIQSNNSLRQVIIKVDESFDPKNSILDELISQKTSYKLVVIDEFDKVGNKDHLSQFQIDPVF